MSEIDKIVYMTIYTKAELEAAIDDEGLIRAIEEGFVLHSQGKVVLPPIGFMHFDKPQGDVHIKYGHIVNAPHYVVKIASSFKRSDGVMLVFCSQTGALHAILHDEGYLTDVRTAVAGAIAAKYLAPKLVQKVGIVGAGSQALLQLVWLQKVRAFKDVMVWARDDVKKSAFCKRPEFSHLNMIPAEDIEALSQSCNLIVTTTASQAPLLHAEQIKPGTHITAVGADDLHKQELAADVFARAALVVVDSRSQCFQYGDCKLALKRGTLREERVLELGEVISQPQLARKSDQEITICDLTGVAIQDIQIANHVLRYFKS